jgi:Asp-tRNA(Asn)/Glu-tRNA(Gln) amidotransferase C subunit
MADIRAETVLQMAEVARLVIPEEDLEEVRAALADYRIVFQPVEDLDLTGVDPALTMDPRWVK